MSQYLRQELHGFFESADKSHVPDLLAWAKELGGYFRRFRGGALMPWVKPDSPEAQQKLDLEARATLAFFEARRHIASPSPHVSTDFPGLPDQIDRMLDIEAAARECGATASVVLLKSLDNPTVPFFVAKKLALTVAHVGYVPKYRRNILRLNPDTETRVYC